MHKRHRPRRARVSLLAFVVVGGLLLVAGLIWQPIQIQKQAYVSADKVLLDFASLAAAELEKRFVTRLGKEVIYPTLIEWCRPHDTGSDRAYIKRALRAARRDGSQAIVNGVALSLFALDLQGLDFVGDPLSGDAVAWLEARAKVATSNGFIAANGSVKAANCWCIRSATGWPGVT